LEENLKKEKDEREAYKQTTDNQIEKLKAELAEEKDNVVMVIKFIDPSAKLDKANKEYIKCFMEKKPFLNHKVTIDNESWTILLKAFGQDLYFSNPLWTNEELLNPEPKDLQNFTGNSAKFISFCKKPVQELLIISKNGYKTRLKLPERKPLLEFFKSDKSIRLSYISGEADPIALACGERGISFYDPKWRINSFSTSNNFKCRLGGFYYKIWGQYGNDSNGYACSAEMAGFGLEDNAWSPFVYNKRSFGIRAAHDSVNYSQGQLSSEAIIYGK